MSCTEPTSTPTTESTPGPATVTQPPARRVAAVRRRTRLARGPITIGEPAPEVEARLAASDPYRPDTIADGGCAFGLTVRGASVRGLYKRYAGGARQDDMCLRLHEPTRSLIVAVADGVSGAPRSDLAAALAVRHAALALARQLDDGGVDALDWGKVFDHAAWALLEQHRRDAEDPRAGVEAAARSLATTLTVALVRSEPAEVRVAAVGDSPVLLLSGDCFTPIVGQPQDLDGLVGGAVEALPGSPASRGSAERSFDTGAVLLVCTDGLALPLGDGSGDLGRALVRELASPPDVIDFARLLDFSRATYDDDRTLVAVWLARESPT